VKAGFKNHKIGMWQKLLHLLSFPTVHYEVNIQTPAHVKPGHSPIHFTDQHTVT